MAALHKNYFGLFREIWCDLVDQALKQSGLYDPLSYTKSHEVLVDFQPASRISSVFFRPACPEFNPAIQKKGVA